MVALKKKLVLVLSILLIFSSCLFFSSCGCSNDEYYNTNNTGDVLDLSSYFDPNLPDGTVEFTHPIMDFEDFERIIPLGKISPPGHTFPTDHIYFVTKGFGSLVYAPARGKILHIGEPGMYGDCDIRIGITNKITYYIGHVFISEGLEVGDIVEVGAQIGTNGNTSCVDFGLINKDVNNVFISQNYPVATLYGDKPLTYYAEPLRSQLYALVKPVQPVEEPDYVYDGGVTDGEFALDQAGTLLGNWFREDCLRPDGWYEWEDTLSFGYDIFYTDQIWIGIGTYSNTFAIKNEDNPINPEDVSVESGIVTYYIYNANNTNKGLPTGDPMGVMLVQMLSDSRIKLEIFEGITSGPSEFTGNASYYVR